MSTKTLRKRIALTAVVAMGLGLLTATSASAGGGVGRAGDLSYAPATSFGVASYDINGKLLAGTATLLTTGTLSLDVDSATTAGTVSKVVVSAGGYIASASTGETVTGDQLSATGGNAIAGRVDIKTNLTSGTFTVTSYASAASGATPVAMVTVTVATASVSGVASATKSTATWTNLPTLGTGFGGVDSSSASETTTGNKLYLNVQIKDAYGSPITSSSGSLIVTASSGANVGSASAAAATAGTYSTTVNSGDATNVNVVVTEATAGAGWSGTVTVTYNGVAIATKSGKITGNVAKLEIAAVKIAKSDSATSNKAISFKATDAAGNQLALAASSVVLDDSSDKAVVSNVTAAGADATATDLGYVSVAAGKAGSANVVLKTTIASTGAVVKSNSVKVLVGGVATSFTASLNKAKYAQGDVAVLTLTFKDAKGNLANSYDSVTSINGAKDSISFPMAKQIGSITGTELPNAAGQIEFKFNIGDVASFSSGKYNAVVTYATPADATAQTVAYEVSGAGGVSNSDILASIVKLITAINKQIAALQKLLLKK